MPSHTACRVAVADAIRENHAGKIVAAGEYRREIAAFVAAGGHGDNVAFQSCKVQRTVRFFMTGPQLHATERPHRSPRAIKLFRFDFLELHAIFDACGTVLGADLAEPPRPCALNRVRESGRNSGPEPRGAKSLTFSSTCRMMLACGSCLSKTMSALRGSSPRASANKLMPSIFPIPATMRFIRQRSIRTTW